MTVADSIRVTAQESHLEGVSHPVFNLHNNWTNSIVASAMLNAFDARVRMADIYMSASIRGLTERQYGALEQLEFKFAGFSHLANWLVNDYGVDPNTMYRMLDWVEEIKTEDDSPEKLAARYLAHDIQMEAGALASEAMIDMKLLDFPDLTREDIVKIMEEERQANIKATKALAGRQFAIMSAVTPEIIDHLGRDIDWVKSIHGRLKRTQPKHDGATAEGYNDAGRISINPFDQQLIKELQFDWSLVNHTYFSRMVSSGRKAITKTATNLNLLANGQGDIVAKMFDRMSKASIDHARHNAASEITAISAHTFGDTLRSAKLVSDTYELKFNATDGAELKELTGELIDARRQHGFADEVPEDDSASMFNYPRQVD